jgi:hypothetical protein
MDPSKTTRGRAATQRNAHTRSAEAAPHTASDVPRLLAELRARGIHYLSGERDPALEAEVAAQPLPARELLLALAGCQEPRVRDAVIALLVLHPALASAIPAAILRQHLEGASGDDAMEQLAVLALAAMYLQSMWRSKLDLILGRREHLSVEHWRARDLPPPADFAGACGLRALAAYERQRRGVAYNFASAWQDQVDHLIAQEWTAHPARASRRERVADTPLATPRESAVSASRMPMRARGLPHTPRGAGAMSMRPPVDRAAIERFLRQLGGEVRQPGRVYLVGGTTMVYEGYRARTLYIDVLIEVDDPGALASLLESVRRLKDSLAVNVELASPGDFIPLSAGWHERSIWIGRFGSLDVFHFDFISVALSKIERGTERDFEDVLALVGGGRIDVAGLDAAFAEILPRVATEGVGAMDPDRFASQYALLKARLASSAE